MSVGLQERDGPQQGPRCENVRRLLPLFVGDDLDRSMARAVSGHLVDCVKCRGEAAGLQQSQKALGAAGDFVPAGVDETMFEDLHERTMAAVEAEAVAAGGFEGDGSFASQRLPLLARGLWAAAAGLLFWLGWWSVSQPEPMTSFDGAPFDRPVPTARSLGEGAELVVPWSGRRAATRQLGYSPDGDGYQDAAEGSGMMLRWNLRSLEDEDDVIGGFEGPEDLVDELAEVPAARRSSGRAKSRATGGNVRKNR